MFGDGGLTRLMMSTQTLGKAPLALSPLSNPKVGLFH